MIKKLLPILIVLVGIGAGIGAGIMLKPKPEPVADLPECAPVSADAHGDGHGEAQADGHGEPAAEAGHGAEQPADCAPAHKPEPAHDSGHDEQVEVAYMNIENQFIVPLVDGDTVGALMVLSISLEIDAAEAASSSEKEPKLRDAFLQVMFDHAQADGFSGPFLAGERMKDLRESLLERANEILNGHVHDVLITDIIRQDI